MNLWYSNFISTDGAYEHLFMNVVNKNNYVSKCPPAWLLCFCFNILQMLYIVTDQQRPRPPNNKTSITVVGLRLSNYLRDLLIHTSNFPLENVAVVMQKWCCGFCPSVDCPSWFWSKWHYCPNNIFVQV